MYHHDSTDGRGSQRVQRLPCCSRFQLGLLYLPGELAESKPPREFAQIVHEQPNEKGIMKMAMHIAGYTHKPDGDISTPRTVLSDPERGLLIPKSDLQRLRNHLRKIYPSLAEKPFSATRLCW